MRPGEMAVIQAGIKFKVRLPDGQARGCKLTRTADSTTKLTTRKTFKRYSAATTSYQSSALWAATAWRFRETLSTRLRRLILTTPSGRVCLSAMFLANVILTMVVVYKLAGKLWACKQNHTPFDVVAWHGKYVLSDCRHQGGTLAYD